MAIFPSILSLSFSLSLSLTPLPATQQPFARHTIKACLKAPRGSHVIFLNVKSSRFLLLSIIKTCRGGLPRFSSYFFFGKNSFLGRDPASRDLFACPRLGADKSDARSLCSGPFVSARRIKNKRKEVCLKTSRGGEEEKPKFSQRTASRRPIDRKP